MKKVVYYIQSIRWFEIIVRMGAPLLALMLTAPALNIAVFAKMLYALLAFFFLWVHIYAFNEWGGCLYDKHDSAKAYTPLLAGKITPREMFLLALVCVFVSSVLYALLDTRLLIIVFVNSVMGVLYVHPKILLKNVPCVSCTMLFLVSVGDFLLGWLVFSPHISQGILIGFYFGILGIVGQSYHEAGDYDSDKRAGVHTNAVRFGKKRIFIIGFAFYTISCLYLCLLVRQHSIPDYLCIPVLVTYPLYALLIAICLRAQLQSLAIHRFVVRYRILYGVIGFAMLILLLMSRPALH